MCSCSTSRLIDCGFRLNRRGTECKAKGRNELRPTRCLPWPVGKGGGACSYCAAEGRSCDIAAGTCGAGKCDSSNCTGCCVGDKCLPGTDGTGAAGLADQTDHHRLAFAGALAATTVLSFGPGVAQALAENDHSGTTTNVFAMPASNLGNSTSQIGENLLNRELNRPNTITVRPGWPLNVLINRDLVMRSYTNG